MSPLDPARREEIDRLAREHADREIQAWGPDQDDVFESWTDEEIGWYYSVRGRVAAERRPARAPVRWPLALPLAAVGAATQGAYFELIRRRRVTALLYVLIGVVASGPLLTWLERRRARQLGLRSAADQPKVPLRVPIVLRGIAPAVSVPLAQGSDQGCAAVAAFFPVWAPAITLWSRRHKDAQDPSWATLLGRFVSYAILRRYDWRRAGGPT
jgi:hypothetical protein